MARPGTVNAWSVHGIDARRSAAVPVCRAGGSRRVVLSCSDRRLPACRDGSLLLLPLLLVLVAALLAPACDSSADRRATAASADPEGPRPAPAATWGGKSGKVLAVDGF